jgi:hypothetical protein
MTWCALLHVIEAHSPGMIGTILLVDQDGAHLRHGDAPSLPETLIHMIDGKRMGPNAGSCGTAAYLGETVIVEKAIRTAGR